VAEWVKAPNRKAFHPPTRVLFVGLRI
jgi:hypothetical protein